MEINVLDIWQVVLGGFSFLLILAFPAAIIYYLVDWRRRKFRPHTYYQHANSRLTQLGKVGRIGFGITAVIIGLSVVACSMYNLFCERLPQYSAPGVNSSNFILKTLAMTFAVVVPAAIFFAGWEWVKAGWSEKHAEFEQRVGFNIYDDIGNYIEEVDGAFCLASSFSHAGAYLSWAASVDLLNPKFNDGVNSLVESGEVTGAKILIEYFYGKLSTIVFTKEGNEFTNDYYNHYFLNDYAFVTSVPTAVAHATEIENEARGMLYELISQQYQKWKNGQPMQSRKQPATT